MLRAAVMLAARLGVAARPSPEERMHEWKIPLSNPTSSTSTANGLTPRTGATLDVFCPANGEQLSTIADATKDDVDRRGRRGVEGLRDLGQDRQGRARHHPEQGRRRHRGQRREARAARVARQRQAHPRDARHRRGVLRSTTSATSPACSWPTPARPICFPAI